jgi:hypothetical protein
MILKLIIIFLAWTGWLIYFRDWFRRYDLFRKTEVHEFEKSKFTVTVFRW